MVFRVPLYRSFHTGAGNQTFSVAWLPHPGGEPPAVPTAGRQVKDREAGESTMQDDMVCSTTKHAVLSGIQHLKVNAFNTVVHMKGNNMVPMKGSIKVPRKGNITPRCALQHWCTAAHGQRHIMENTMMQHHGTSSCLTPGSDGETTDVRRS